MTDFPGSIENAMVGDNIEDSQQDENVSPYSNDVESVGKDIASSLDNMSRAIVESVKILANKMSCPYDRNEKLFTSLQTLDLSQEYLFECYDFLTEHETAANKFLGIPQQFKKEMLARIMISASVSM